MATSASNQQRQVLRREVRLHCQAVSESEFRLVGRRALDLSPAGMLLESDDDVRVGDALFVSFRAPQSALYIDTSARVVRVVAGRRPGDHGRCLGLQFEDLDAVAKGVLAESLVGMPPPLPRRPRPQDHAAEVRAVAEAREFHASCVYDASWWPRFCYDGAWLSAHAC
jgi:hypothetical protein